MKSAIYAALGASLLSSFATVAAAPQSSGSGLTHTVPPPPCLVSWFHYDILLPPKPPALRHLVYRPPLSLPATQQFLAPLTLPLSPQTVPLHPKFRRLRHLHP